MAIFCLMRKQFLDRVFRLDELAEMSEMLVRWYLIPTEVERLAGQCHCEAIVYSFPRPDGQTMQQTLASELPDAAFDASVPDELRVIGAARPVSELPDLSVWRVVLSEPKLQQACVLLRLTITGPIRGPNKLAENGTTTFVFCGATEAGAILIKALWVVGFEQNVQLLYRTAPWRPEAKLLEAFDLYQKQRVAGMSEEAAKWSYNLFGKETCHIFNARSTERNVLWIIRHWAEMPDDRGPAAFARRLAMPLSASACSVAIAILCRDSRETTILASMAAFFTFLFVARILWNKAARIVRYHTAMRRGLGQLYSAPIDRKQIDLSTDKSPSLLKCSAEIAALGARHLCDVSIETARGVLDGNRVYTLADSSITIGLLRNAETYIYFPARPILLVSTRFKDGTRHYTVNKPLYRKRSNPKTTGRCLLSEGGVSEVLALHRRHVDKLIAAGAVPLSPPNTPTQLFEQMRHEHEESRKAWQKSPYSWGDALHDGFKVCRREYLAD